MGFDLMGLEPRAVQEYIWAGDDAVDLAASDTVQWRKSGVGLRVRDGATPAVIKWQALKDTVRDAVWRVATVGIEAPASPVPVSFDDLVVANMPHVRLAACAYGIQAIENLPALEKIGGFRQKLVPGGLRVEEHVLDALAGVKVELPNPPGQDGKPLKGPDGSTVSTVKLLQHLGRLILDASKATEHEKKV
jgi:hypothetical protein